jgi:hypothetical protein
MSGAQILDDDLRKEGTLPIGQEDYMNALLQVYYLVKDEQVITLMQKDSLLAPLLPMISHLNRTSNMGKTEIEICKLRSTIALRLQLLVKEKPTLVSLGKFYAWRNYMSGVYEDTREGWRGRLSTEKIKTYRIESGERKRSRFLGLR